MNRLLTRILFSIVLWPIATVSYFSLFLLMEQSLRDEYAFIWSGIAVGFSVAVAWWLLWRSWVNWTPWRVRATWTCIAISIAFGFALTFLIDFLYSRSFGVIIGCPLAIVFWPLLTIFIWRETEEECRNRSHGVICLNCGYDLTGLHECRCPECGHEYTIDQLYANQPERQRSAFPVVHETS